jgi:hypothetical protein
VSMPNSPFQRGGLRPTDASPPGPSKKSQLSSASSETSTCVLCVCVCVCVCCVLRVACCVCRLTHTVCRVVCCVVSIRAQTNTIGRSQHFVPSLPRHGPGR